MSFWSGEKLEIELPKLIEGFDKELIDGAAYTLRIGGEIYVSPSDKKEANTQTTRKLQDSDSFVIPPGQFAFLLTEERVKVPDTAVAFISMKARIKFRGLVNVSGFHVDPGYHGPLVFAVFNAGPARVHLKRGDDCFLIWYASLDQPTKYLKKPGTARSLSSELLAPVSGRLVSLESLSSRLDKVERSHETLKLSAGVALTLLAGIILMLLRGCIPGPSINTGSGSTSSVGGSPTVQPPVEPPPQATPVAQPTAPVPPPPAAGTAVQPPASPDETTKPATPAGSSGKPERSGSERQK